MSVNGIGTTGEVRKEHGGHPPADAALEADGH